MRSLSVVIPLVLLCAGAATATEVVVASGSPAGVLERHAVPDGTTALALSPDGNSLAYALPSVSKEGFSEIVRIAHQTGREPATLTLTLPGDVRDLLLLGSGELLGLQYRPAKKRVGETFLFRVGPGAAKAERVMRVPPSSADLDRWPGGDAILLACRNEIRTLIPPDYRSGPLFSVPGHNFAVTSLGNSSFVLVGQAEALQLIDLAAPSGREPMPVLARRTVSAPVAALADYPSGSEVLVRLDDGRLFRAAFDPVGFRSAGNADHIAGLAKAPAGPDLPFAAVAAVDPPRPPEPTPIPIPAPETTAPQKEAPVERPAPIVPPDSEAPVVAEPLERPADPPTQAPPPSKAAAPAIVEDSKNVVEPDTASEEREVAAEPPVGIPVPEPEPGEPPIDIPVPESEPAEPPMDTPVPEPEPAEPPAQVEQTAPPAPPKHLPQLGGRIGGNVALVRDIVLLGPDNILNEAARVQPDAAGRWGVDGLRPGRYRILLDGGGDRVLVAEPRCLLIELGDQPVEAPEIKVLRAF